MNIVLWNSNERTELTEFLRVVDAWCWFSGQKLILFSGFPCDHKFLPQRINNTTFTRNLPTHSTAFNLSSQEFRSSVQWRARIFVKSDALCGVHAYGTFPSIQPKCLQFFLWLIPSLLKFRSNMTVEYNLMTRKTLWPVSNNLFVFGKGLNIFSERSRNFLKKFWFSRTSRTLRKQRGARFVVIGLTRIRYTQQCTDRTIDY